MLWVQSNAPMKSVLTTTLLPFIIRPSLPCSLTPSVPFFLLPVPAFLPSPLFLPSPSWHSALSLIVDNWVGGAVGRPCLCVQRASGQVNGALVSSWEHSVSLFSSVRSLGQSISVSQSASLFFHGWSFSSLFRSSFTSFPAVSHGLSFQTFSVFSHLCFPPSCLS